MATLHDIRMHACTSTFQQGFVMLVIMRHLCKHHDRNVLKQHCKYLFKGIYSKH